MSILLLVPLVLLLTNVLGVGELLFWFVLEKIMALVELILTGGLIYAIFDYTQYQYMLVTTVLGGWFFLTQIYSLMKNLALGIFTSNKENGKLNGYKERIGMVWRISRAYTHHQIRKYLFPPVQRVGSNFAINYSIGMREYQILVPRIKKSNLVQMVHDQDDNDVTTRIKGFLGPGENCHNQTITPSNLGYIELHFELYDGSTIVVGQEELIVFD